jgi:6-pyruvoyltetrahydropterin/6-carboxytetrahydropterin synthase
MKAAKRFRFEAAHRLPWHEGDCKNLHGHSYHLEVVFEGATDDRGMLVDFHKIKELVKPLADAWDHATLIADYDDVLLNFVKSQNWRHYVLPYDSTSENLCLYVWQYLQGEHAMALTRHGITKVIVQVGETETCYAAEEFLVTTPVAVGDGAHVAVALP